jgi:uncharacterized protein (TIGR02246 family)
MKADLQTEAAVMAVLDDFNDAVATRNFNKVLGLFTSDQDVFLLASEAGERAIGREELESFFRRAFSRSAAYSWTWREWIVSASGPVAWVALDATVHMSDEQGVRSAPYRITVVLERRGGKWLLVQYHGSEPAQG